MDEERLFRSCTYLAKDPDFFIRKAIGWMLREYSKTNANAVRQFLQQATLSPLSLREATKYLD
jgi:3-methyladenine DNA glycosylase AlkD